jgi:hypothetical protein
LKKSIPVILEHLTWISRNEKTLRIWEDSIFGKSNICQREDLGPLKQWMEMQNLKTLYDISTWDEQSRSWVGWSLGAPPTHLDSQVLNFFQALFGYTPRNKSEKDKGGWGNSF